MEAGSSTGLSNITKATSPISIRLAMCGTPSIEPLADTYQRLMDTGHGYGDR